MIPFRAPKFSLKGTITGRVVNLHDGDTFTCVIPFLDKESSLDTHYKFSIRLAGIDTCEMTSINSILKSKGFLARDRLFKLITGTNINTLEWRRSDFERYFERNYTTVELKCKDIMDKYGRVLADVYDFADVLVREKLAYRYDGGTKLTDSQILAQVSSDTFDTKDSTRPFSSDAL